jgi:hypothetical protein
MKVAHNTPKATSLAHLEAVSDFWRCYSNIKPSYTVSSITQLGTQQISKTRLSRTRLSVWELLVPSFDDQRLELPLPRASAIKHQSHNPSYSIQVAMLPVSQARRSRKKHDTNLSALAHNWELIRTRQSLSTATTLMQPLIRREDQVNQLGTTIWNTLSYIRPC